jgi:hypothetical protein
MGKSQYTLAKRIGRKLSADLTFEQVRDQIDVTYAGELDGLKLDIATDTAIRARNAVQRLADAPLRPKVDQKPADHGLFGDERDQTDLVDLIRSKEQS